MKDQSVAALVEGNMHLKACRRLMEDRAELSARIIERQETLITRKQFTIWVLSVVSVVNTVAFWIVFAVLLTVL